MTHPASSGLLYNVINHILWISQIDKTSFIWWFRPSPIKQNISQSLFPVIAGGKIDFPIFPSLFFFSPSVCYSHWLWKETWNRICKKWNLKLHKSDDASFGEKNVELLVCMKLWWGLSFRSLQEKGKCVKRRLYNPVLKQKTHLEAPGIPQ